MSKEIDWSKAPEGTTHWVGGTEPWHKHIGDTSWYWQESQQKWYQLRICASDVEHEYRETIVKRPDQEWNGTGLPPVGTVCEARHEEINGGLPVIAEVLKHHENGKAVAFYWIDAPDGETNLLWAGRFMPIRTPEQIAAEEREKAVLEMVKDSGSPAACLHPMPAIFGRLYDAGYRKTEAAK